MMDIAVTHLQFSEWFLELLVIAALLGTAGAVLALIGMFFRDLRAKRLW